MSKKKKPQKNQPETTPDEPLKEPSDLGLKVGTHAQALWEQVAQTTRGHIEQAEKELIVQRAVLEMAERKIEAEKEKF